MTSSIRTFLACAAALTLTLLLGLPGCGGDDGGGGGPPGFGGGGSGGTSGFGGADGGGTGGVTGAGVCLLNNCHSDAECEACSYGRNKCKLDETRCIACASESDCKPGEQCTGFGICAPKDLTCPTDGSGNPTISCAKDLDCAACDPMHQVCDTNQGKCVSCIGSNAAACTGNQTCGQTGKCEDKCPASCTQDSDCGKCENATTKANACNNHVCAECSTTSPCPTGLSCENGKCIKPCGSAGGEGAVCKQDAECYGCGNNAGSTSWKCKLPVNSPHGTCTLPSTVAGCTDLLSSGLVLPPPFDKVTNTCSGDANCAGVSMDVDVGKLIADIIGTNQINLGIKKITLQPAIVKFPMAACASLELFDGKKCGVCVPCNDDADCKPINLDALVSDLFKGDPLAQIAAAFLMDLLFGKDKEHQLHMQCEKVGGTYGVCLPCANPLSACGAGSSTGPTSGKCEHDKCKTGPALDPKCGVCEAAVCLVDPFCCTLGWDDICVQAVDELCGTPCPGDPTCQAHNPCTVGGAMNEKCSTCTTAVCDVDPSCCNLSGGTWAQKCVDLVLNDTNVKPQCGGACQSPSSCSHPECQEGTPLTTTCSECAKIVCGKDPWCCDTQTPGKWDLICVSEAAKEPKCPTCPKQ